MKTNFFLIFKVLLILQLFSSCAYLKGASESNTDSGLLKRLTREYELVDKSGRFIVKRDRGYLKAHNNFVVKKKVHSFNKPNGKILEKSITISTPGTVGKSKLRVLRPKVSQYTVWFDAKKYSTKMTVNLEERSLLVSLKSPEEQWRGSKSYTFPKGTGVYCFYSQLIECARITGFLHQAVKKKGGVMKFHIIWDGYPYFQEQYLNIPSTVFERVSLVYEGENRNGLIRFTLKTDTQVMFFLLDKQFEVKKQLWVSQGYSMVDREL